MTSRTWFDGRLRAVSYLMVLKGIVGGSIALLALFGAFVPQSTVGQQGLVACIGAVMGALLALKS